MPPPAATFPNPQPGVLDANGFDPIEFKWCPVPRRPVAVVPSLVAAGCTDWAAATFRSGGPLPLIVLGSAGLLLWR